jgi:hypothetical protein
MIILKFTQSRHQKSEKTGNNPYKKTGKLWLSKFSLTDNQIPLTFPGQQNSLTFPGVL